VRALTEPISKESRIGDGRPSAALRPPSRLQSIEQATRPRCRACLGTGRARSSRKPMTQSPRSSGEHRLHRPANPSTWRHDAGSTRPIRARVDSSAEEETLRDRRETRCSHMSFEPYGGAPRRLGFQDRSSPAGGPGCYGPGPDGVEVGRGGHEARDAPLERGALAGVNILSGSARLTLRSHEEATAIRLPDGEEASNAPAID
jgi:hypothetical protein